MSAGLVELLFVVAVTLAFALRELRSVRAPREPAPKSNDPAGPRDPSP